MVLRYIFVFLCFSIVARFIFYDPLYTLCRFHSLSLSLRFSTFQDFLHLLNSAVTSSPFTAILCSHTHTHLLYDACYSLRVTVCLGQGYHGTWELLPLKPPYLENLLPLINSDMWKDTNVFVCVSEIAHSRHYLFFGFLRHGLPI